jgi:hypothetical protein
MMPTDLEPQQPNRDRDRVRDVGVSHSGRCRSDAAFAARSGTSPLEASSGRTVRHRLNRGGYRALK